MARRESLSERLTSLGDSKSYMFLGRRESGNSGEYRSSVQSRSNTIHTAVTNTNHLVRDDILIFELIFHAQDDENGDRKTNIRHSSDYSVLYHHWTLRQLYKYVVSSTKIQSSTTATSATASATPKANASNAPHASADAVGNSATRRRPRSISMSGEFGPFDPNDANAPPAFPPPLRLTQRATSTASITSRLHRRNSSNYYQNNNMPKLLGSSLHPRDMRRLVTPFSASNEPELIVRRHVMVFNFDPLRAIITRDRLLVLVPNGADSVLKNLEERIVGSGLEFDGYNEETNSDERDEDDSAIFDMSLKLNDLEKGMPESVKEADENKDENDVDDHNDNNDDNEDDEGDDWSEMMMMEMEGNREELTFELLCVNACLSTVFEMLADDTRELQDKGMKCVQERVIGNGSGRRPHKKQLRPEDALAVIRNLKNAVKVMQARVKGFVHSINRILNEDEDMALMNLSRLITHPENFVQPVSQEMLEVESDEPELVLESNLHNALTLSNALDLIQGQVETASDLIDARMDAARNKFLLATLLMSIASLSLTALTCVAGIFGMNLHNHMENEPHAFFQVTYGSLVGSALLGVAIFVGFVRTGVITGIGPVDQDGIDSLF